MNEYLLLLEDDEALRHHLGRKLERHQYQVIYCATLSDARDAVKSNLMIDVAVLDQNVGSDNGLDLITPLLEKFPACRILILTGYGSIPAAVAATRRGARNYLTKPASLNDILHAISDDAATALPALPDAPPSLERLEWDHIQRVMEEHDGNISAAARTLGIHRRTLQRRLKKRPSASEYERDRS
ncbi:MAG: response regulator [Alcanivoracaceae bacterium]|nr:response regulator [Alcanivoracaceae bacterium]